MSQPSLYEMLTGYYADGFPIDAIEPKEQLLLSVLDNVRRILNTRAGTLSHLPDYGLPDMSKLIQGLPATAHGVMGVLSSTLIRYEPRIKSLSLVLLSPNDIGSLRYALDIELHEQGVVRCGTEFTPNGQLLIHHLKKHYAVD